MERYEIECTEKRSGTTYGGTYDGDLANCVEQLHEDFPFYSPADDSARIWEVKPDGRRLRIA